MEEELVIQEKEDIGYLCPSPEKVKVHPHVAKAGLDPSGKRVARCSCIKPVRILDGIWIRLNKLL